MWTTNMCLFNWRKKWHSVLVHTHHRRKNNERCMEFHSFTQHRQKMSTLLDSWLDTNLRQLSKKNTSKVSRIQWKVGQKKLFKLTPTSSPRRWGTGFLRWAVYSPNLFLLQLLAKLSGCSKESRSFQASSVSHPVLSNLPLSTIQRIRRSKKLLISSNHLCSVPGQGFQKLLTTL